MVHIWTQKQRHAPHIMRQEMGLNWPEIAQIFSRIFNVLATVKWVRDDYNNRDKAGRSQMWSQHIIKTVYTPQEQSDRAAVRADIVTAARALNINLPNANAPAAAQPAPPTAPAAQPAHTSNVQGTSNIAQAAQTVPTYHPASSALPTTTVPALNPISTYTTVSNHGLSSRPSIAFTRTAPGSSTSGRLGPKFVLAGHPDPSEEGRTSEPSAKKPATAERIHTARALPSVRPVQQPNPITNAQNIGIGFVFGSTPQASPAGPQPNISTDVAEAAAPDNLTGMDNAQSPMPTARSSHNHPSPEATKNSHPDTSPNWRTAIVPLSAFQPTDTNSAQSIAILGRYLVGDSPSGLTAFSRMSTEGLEAWLQQQGIRVGAGVRSVAEDYGNVGGGVQDYAHPGRPAGNALNVGSQPQPVNAVPVLNGIRGGDETAGVSEDIVGEDGMALSEPEED